MKVDTELEQALENIEGLTPHQAASVCRTIQTKPSPYTTQVDASMLIPMPNLPLPFAGDDAQ